MDLRVGEHPDEDSLEKYLLGSLDQHEAKQIEEHLLMCQVCIETASKLRYYIQAMRKGLETGRQTERQIAVVTPGRGGD
jgi:hypothetical protein